MLREIPFIVHQLLHEGINRKLNVKLNESELFLYSIAICQSYHKLKSDCKEKPSDSDSPVPINYNIGLQEKLQIAVDHIDFNSAIDAVKEGAVVEPHLIRELSLHIGDQYTSLFSYLLSRSPLYLAERFIRKDMSVTVNICQHPMNAVLLSTQLERWCHKKNLTCRETSSITETSVIANSFGGSFEGIFLWRSVVLHLIDKKIRNGISKCVMLPETRSVDEEVVEVMKRKKIERLQTIRRSLTGVVGLPAFNEPINGFTYYQEFEIPPLIQTKPIELLEESSIDPEKPVKSIYTVLLEFNVLTGRLANEAKAIRKPRMERDKRLLVNGFIKQSRSDFLSLRRQCMTPAQLNEEQEEKRKQEDKEKKKLEKEMGVNKKKKKKSSGKKKKGKNDKSDNDDSNNEDDLIDMNLDAGPGLEIYKEMEYIEEISIKEESEFHHRTEPFKNLFTETWIPHYYKKYERDNNFINRNRNDIKAILKRLMDYLKRDKMLANTDLLFCQNQSGGIGLWLLNLGVTDPKFKSSRIWSVLPKDWWNSNTIKSRILQEQVLIDALIRSLTNNIENNCEKKEKFEKDINLFQKYLKKSRKKI